MKINEIIRRLRNSRGLTQENIADEIGVHVTTMVRYENDGTIPDGKLESLAKALGVTVSDIYAYKDNPSLLSEPMEYYKTKKKVSITIELDGTAATLNEWLSTLKKINAALV